MRGRLKKVRMPFFARLGKWIWHGCIMSVTRVPPHETIAHMLAFRFLNGRAAVCGDSFVHRKRALHRRVHVYKYHLGSLRGVNGYSRRCRVFVWTIRLLWLSWTVEENIREANQTATSNLSVFPAFCVQICKYYFWKLCKILLCVKWNGCLHPHSLFILYLFKRRCFFILLPLTGMASHVSVFAPTPSPRVRIHHRGAETVAMALVKWGLYLFSLHSDDDI